MLTLPVIELSGLWPFIGISSLAILVLLASLFLGDFGRKISIPLAVIGCVLLSVYVLSLPDATVVTFQGGLANSGVSQWLTVLFLLAAALSLLMAAHPRFTAHALPGELAALVLFSTAGMVLAVQARDLLVLFLGIELTSLPIYCLVGMNKQDKAANEAALKYFLMGAFSTAIFLFGFAIIFGTVGDFRYAVLDGSTISNQGLNYPIYILGQYFVFASLLFKAAAVPFHMWAPDAYQGAPAPIAGFMSAAVKAMAISTLFLVSFPLSSASVAPLIPLILLSTIGGNLLALNQTNLKRMLAYSSISHAGYLLIAILTYPRLGGLVPIIFYLFGYTFMTIGAFGVVGWLAEEKMGECSIDRVKGLYHRNPAAALALTLFMLGMAGIPPLAGFMGKFYLFRSAMGTLNWLILSLAAIGSAIGVYYYLRVIVACYMEEESPAAKETPWPLSFKLAITICALGTVALGLFPQPLISAITSAVSSFQP